MKRVHKSIQVDMSDSYKLGIDEIVGLREAIADAFLPVRDALRDKAYWDKQLDFETMEYKRRDGFIPHSHNCGGLVLGLHVPECESYEWGFLEFGELTEEYTRDEEPWENEGELDAYLRIIFKFEGVDKEGNLQFYLNASGGNNDAPYFRVNKLPDLFEAEFSCEKLSQIKMKAKPYIRKILALIEGAV